MCKRLNRSRIFIFLFLVAVISLRIILETAFLSDRLNFYLFIHHFAWFLSVFTLVALIARYLIGIPREKLHYILYASPIILLPMVHAWIVGGKFHLQYIRSGFSDMFFHMLTFNLFHPQNFVQSSLLILLFISLFVATWQRKGVLKALFVSVEGYIFLYLFMGVQWFGVAPNTKAIFAVNTTLSNHQFLALIYTVVAVIEGLILFLPEFKRS